MTKLKHQGWSTHRFKDNPAEKAFATAWDTYNVQGHTLEYLLGNGVQREPATPREIEVAATVVQWLGSPVGLCFLRDVFEANATKFGCRCGCSSFAIQDKDIDFDT